MGIAIGLSALFGRRTWLRFVWGGGQLFRVAQEALNNIAKHARARTVWVTVQRTEAGLLLRIRDDGEGFDLKSGVRPTAVGLVGNTIRQAKQRAQPVAPADVGLWIGRLVALWSCPSIFLFRSNVL